MRNLFFLSLLSLPSLVFSQQIHYVNQVATGANTGDTWADAYSDLQTALTVATAGDQIWVATGTYLPTSDTSRDRSFDLPTGVKLYGGFSGTENQLNQRLPTEHKTELSGDIGVTGVKTDNSYHVVTIYRGDEQTVLDGFTITQGYGEDFGAGFPYAYGGGVLVSSDLNWPVAVPVIAQCMFERNRAGAGGGLACVANDFTHCLPTVRKCNFKANQSQLYGGGMYTFGANVLGKAFEITDCKFEANKTSIGGGIYMEGITDTLLFHRCTFVNDTVREGGGAFIQIGGQFTYCEVDSCNFTANHMQYGAGGGFEFMVPGEGLIDSVGLVIQNSTFFLNKSGIGAGITAYALFDLKQFNCRVEKCIFESNISSNGGGAILVEAGDGVASDVSVDRCFFLGNTTLAASVAGGFYYRGFGGTLIRNRSTITNSVFMYNDGAIAALGGQPGISYTQIVNCSFYRNGDIPFVKYWGPDSNPVDLLMEMQILNSVLWEPQVDGVKRLFYNNDPVNFTLNDYKVEHSMVHLSDCLYNGVDPCGEGMIYGQWPNFIDSSGQLGLITFDFAGKNRGSNIVADTFGIETDYLGLPRIYCDTIDIGAYEIQGLCQSSTYEQSFAVLPVGIHILQNPISKGIPIDVELYAAIPENLKIQLLGPTGYTFYERSVKISGAVPSVLQIPSNDLIPGLYYLRVMDNYGRTKTEKVIIVR